MGLFVLDTSKKPNIKSKIKTAINNLEVFTKNFSNNYLINSFAIPLLKESLQELYTLTNWHKIEPSQEIIDKFWKDFNDSRTYSQSKNGIFISAFQSALYDHLNDLNLLEDSQSDYILISKEEYETLKNNR